MRLNKIFKTLSKAVLLTSAVAIFGVFGFSSCTKSSSTTSGTDSSSTSNPGAAVSTTSNASGPKSESVTALKIEDTQKGTGAVAAAGQTVTVHYTGWLTNGTKFDSSLDRKQPFKFKLGAGQVIAGWDQGVAGMAVGGKRRLTIPPTLGYGSRGVGPIPPDSTLVFDVELLGVE